MRIRRTLLYIPGNSPNMIVNAAVLGADGIVLDIEDAVSPKDKDAARILIRNALGWVDRSRLEFCVRINDVNTPYWKKDLSVVVPANPDALLIPKVEFPEELAQVDEFVTKLEHESDLPDGRIKLFPILETAMGIENSYIIAASRHERLDALLLGAEDLATSLGALRTDSGEEIAYGRSRMVNAARAANLMPIDTAYANIDNIDGFISDTRLSRQLGYAGRAVISPRQVSPANTIYSPSESDIRYAGEVITIMEEAKKAGKGAVSRRGKMIDGPMITRARHVLEFAKHIQWESDE
ncbi:MAG: CoA ester lyase [Synergistaceae bacterium]|jgi:citrate lyase subunit beta/citryl-CoA lyase|nr:CoA ester lyase [Synergistaceae bacterium]